MLDKKMSERNSSELTKQYLFEMNTFYANRVKLPRHEINYKDMSHITNDNNPTI